ncbi:HTTM domain-containing protein [Mycobacterium genavense]|uniref:HTTM domain-containing protein n=1 Tax=Mycobacterium genavense TaxID=36812 RepID=UPI0004705E62|nr:HTTM domain-containing protein [Mycobacterium genavense]
MRPAQPSTSIPPADARQNRTTSLINAVNRWYFVCYARRYSLIGSALSRIAIALVSLLLIGTNYSARDYYWGPFGGYPLSSYFTEIKYAYSYAYGFHGGGTYFQLVFHLQIIVTIVYLIGYRTRITALIFYFMLFSLCERNDHLLNGGTNLIMTMSPFLAVIDSSRYLSVDAILGKRRPRCSPTGRYLRGAVYGTLLHNFAILLIFFQISLLYFTAGVNKLQGPLWMRGEAIYYILASPVFGIRALDEFLSQHLVVTAFLTYSTVLFQWHFQYSYAGNAHAPQSWPSPCYFTCLSRWSWAGRISLSS